MQTGQSPTNNRQSGNTGGEETSKAETDKISNKKVGEASSEGKKKNCYYCGSDKHLLLKCSQLSIKNKNVTWQKLLKQHQKQQVQVVQVEEGHLHLQLDNSENDAAADVHDPLYQVLEDGFVFFQKE